MENILAVAHAGVPIFPAMPAFYNRPATISDFVNQNLGRLLDMFYFDDPSLNHQDGLVGNPVSENQELKA
ncbi:hypothetical protein ACFXK8_004015 [Enterobacter kobei]